MYNVILINVDGLCLNLFEKGLEIGNVSKWFKLSVVIIVIIMFMLNVLLESLFVFYILVKFCLYWLRMDILILWIK